MNRFCLVGKQRGLVGRRQFWEPIKALGNRTGVSVQTFLTDHKYAFLIVGFYFFTIRSNDDAFMIYLALWSGPRCYLFSKDEYRQHRFTMGAELSEQLSRWQAARQICLRNGTKPAFMVCDIPPFVMLLFTGTCSMWSAYSRRHADGMAHSIWFRKWSTLLPSAQYLALSSSTKGTTGNLAVVYFCRNCKLMWIILTKVLTVYAGRFLLRSVAKDWKIVSKRFLWLGAFNGAIGLPCFWAILLKSHSNEAH